MQSTEVYNVLDRFKRTVSTGRTYQACARENRGSPAKVDTILMLRWALLPSMRTRRRGTDVPGLSATTVEIVEVDVALDPDAQLGLLSDSLTAE